MYNDRVVAEILAGKAALADVLFLIAAVLFVVVAWVRWTDRSIAATLEPLGLALLAVAFFVL